MCEDFLFCSDSGGVGYQYTDTHIRLVAFSLSLLVPLPLLFSLAVEMHVVVELLG